MSLSSLFLFFFFNDPATSEIYTLSLHDALPICAIIPAMRKTGACSICQRPLPPGHRKLCKRRSCKAADNRRRQQRSEEHTSELQSHVNLVCRLLLEKKKKKKKLQISINIITHNK